MVLDDPSLSRKHAKLYRRGPAELEVEDLSSSNGTFINQRKVGRGAVHPGDTLRFGELGFRVEGDTLHGTQRRRRPSCRARQFFALAGGAAVTLILLVLMIVFLVRKPTPVQAPGKDAIARISRQADAHVRQGRTLIGDRKYLEAKGELDQALELDPANAEARRLRNLAVRAPEDEKYGVGGDRQDRHRRPQGAREALRLYDDTTDGTPAHARAARPARRRRCVSFGNYAVHAAAPGPIARGRCAARGSWRRPTASPTRRRARMLRDAERKIHDRSYVRCRAAP